MDFKENSDERAEPLSGGGWNYRVAKHGKYLAIYEVYYYENGNVRGSSQDPVSPEAEDLAQLKTTLELMLEATDKDILDLDE